MFTVVAVSVGTIGLELTVQKTTGVCVCLAYRPGWVMWGGRVMSVATCLGSYSAL